MEALYNIFLLLSALCGYIFRNLMSRFLECAWWNFKVWKTRKKDGQSKMFQYTGSADISFRYVHTAHAIGTAMLRQYENAQRVVLFFGDCDFLLLEKMNHFSHALRSLTRMVPWF